MKRLGLILATIFASRAFFFGVMLFFVIQALWFVFSAIYPMAFDEEVHLGTIRIYSEQWSPFLSPQPPTSDAFGAIQADPSYLYHYLMSFPYRLLTVLTSNEMWQVIALRLINVALFAYALVLFRRVLLQAGLSLRLSNVSIALFTLIPIVPMLAAHINYDNLLMLLVAWLCLLGMRLIRHARERVVEVRDWWLLALLFLFGSLVKYAFLPIIVGAVFIVIIYTWRQFRGKGRLFWSRARKGIRGVSRRAAIVATLLFLLGAGLFIQRYGVNALRYGHPVPDCAAVLSEQRCTAYGPWNRNHLLAQTKDSVNEGPVYYMGEWLDSMWHRLFFTVNGPTRGHATQPPLPVPSITAIALALALGVSMVVAWRQLRQRPALLYLLGFTALYVAALWIEDYSQFVETGKPVAINGRYLLPILLPLAAVAGTAASYLLRKQAFIKPYLAAGVLLLFLYGGGVFTFIARSDASWNWPNKAIVKANDVARKVTLWIVYEGRRWN